MSVPSLPADSELARLIDQRLADTFRAAVEEPRPGLWCGLCGATCGSLSQLLDHPCYGPPAPLHGILSEPLRDVVLSDRSGLRVELRAAAAIEGRPVGTFRGRGAVT